MLQAWTFLLQPLVTYTASMEPKDRSSILHGMQSALPDIVHVTNSSNRLRKIRELADGRVRLVLHGTNGFKDEVTQQCIKAGVSKININKLVLEDYNNHIKHKSSSMILTQLMEEGIKLVTVAQEHQMDASWSTGKAK